MSHLIWIVLEPRPGERLAEHGRALLRLDCVASNDFLRRYYAAAGFSERGEARLRELRLRRFERAVPPRS
jgi:hypothetical protein